MQSKAQIIDAILQHNPTAPTAWLANFTPEQLGRYLAHLQFASEPRGQRSYWLRPGDAPAILTRRPAA